MVDCVSHFLVGIGVFFVFCNIFEVDIEADLVRDIFAKSEYILRRLDWLIEIDILGFLPLG